MWMRWTGCGLARNLPWWAVPPQKEGSQSSHQRTSIHVHAFAVKIRAEQASPQYLVAVSSGGNYRWSMLLPNLPIVSRLNLKMVVRSSGE